MNFKFRVRIIHGDQSVKCFLTHHPSRPLHAVFRRVSNSTNKCPIAIITIVKVSTILLSIFLFITVGIVQALENDSGIEIIGTAQWMNSCLKYDGVPNIEVPQLPSSSIWGDVPNKYVLPNYFAWNVLSATASKLVLVLRLKCWVHFQWTWKRQLYKSVTQSVAKK